MLYYLSKPWQIRGGLVVGWLKKLFFIHVKYIYIKQKIHCKITSDFFLTHQIQSKSKINEQEQKPNQTERKQTNLIMTSHLKRSRKLPLTKKDTGAQHSINDEMNLPATPTGRRQQE